LYASEAKNKNQQKIPKEVQKTVVFFRAKQSKTHRPCTSKDFLFSLFSAREKLLQTVGF